MTSRLIYCRLKVGYFSMQKQCYPFNTSVNLCARFLAVNPSPFNVRDIRLRSNVKGNPLPPLPSECECSFQFPIGSLRKNAWQLTQLPPKRYKS